jgi:Type IV secretion-system coupling protein DNA-binding domain
MEKITPIGITNYQNKHIRFGIKAKDRSGHIYCIGKTGVGKSTLLLNMAIADILNGDTVAIIDPHGDLATTILSYIPYKRINDVIYFDTSCTTHSIAYNPLQDIADEDKYVTAANIVLVFKKIWADSWGPRLEHILRNTIHSLTYYPTATLLDIQPILTDYYFRKLVITFIKDQALLDFWHNEFEPLTAHVKAEHIASIVNKIGILATHPKLKAILSSNQTSFSIEDIFNKNKIFIANLSKGSIGEAGSQLLGSLLITAFQTQSLKRANRPIEERTPVYLYIDEIHSFMTDSFIDILSESRKYGLCLFITHQYTEQLTEEILNSILGNVGTLICFRIGAKDALTLEQEFTPTLCANDLVNLPQYSIYLKLLIDGTTSQPFSANTFKLSHTAFNYHEYIKQESKRKFGSVVKTTRIFTNNTHQKTDEATQQNLDFG